MVSAGTSSEDVVQVALPPAVTVTAGQSAFATPLMAKVTVPAGMTGESVPESCAVKVTDVPTFTGLAEGVRLIVGLSALTVWVTGEAVAVVKLVSPDV